MSYNQKEDLISLFNTIVISIPYYMYILGLDPESSLGADNELMFWARAILLLIPIRIVAEIIMHILVAIGTAIITQSDKFDETVDERDKLIELKSNRNSYIFFMIIMLATISMVALGAAGSAVMIVFIAGGILSEFVSFLSSLYYYNKGV